MTGVLGEEISRDDNFFLLGGHSLMGAQLISQLREAFGVEITLRSLFDAPTVAGLSAEIERKSHSILGKMTVEPGRGVFPLTVETARRFSARRAVLVGEEN